MVHSSVFCFTYLLANVLRFWVGIQKSIFLIFQKHHSEIHVKSASFGLNQIHEMKIIKNILLLAILLIVLTSCKDDDPRPDYYYRFKVNGVQKEFRANKDSGIVFLDAPNSINKIIFFTMVTGADPEKNAIVISLRSTEEAESGIEYKMQEPLTVNNTIVPRISIVYFDENGKTFGATLLQSLNPGARDDARLKFTQITTEGSYGEFQAIAFDMSATGDLGSRQELLITDGEFFMPNFVSLL